MIDEHDYFPPDTDAASRYVEAVIATEDALIDAEMLASDFMILIGRKK